MDLEEHIREMRLGIETRQFPNETIVAQRIVLRFLRRIGRATLLLF
jgi:hypothetical protein